MMENARPHNNGNNGNGRRFWKFNVNTLAIILGLAISAASTFIIFDRGLQQQKSIVSSLVSSVTDLADKVRKIDEEGSAASKAAIKIEHTTAEANSRRLDTSERLLQDLSPKIQQIGDNLDILNQWILRQDPSLILPRHSDPRRREAPSP